MMEKEIDMKEKGLLGNGRKKRTRASGSKEGEMGKDKIHDMLE